MKKNKIVSVLCAAALLFGSVAVAFPASAADNTRERVGRDYYFSSNKGNDNNDGASPDNPLYSLNKLDNVTLSPGDRILLETGSVFTGYIHPKGSGTEENPIVIDAYEGGKVGDQVTGAKPIINGNGKGIWYQNYGKPMDNGTNTNEYNSTHKGRGFVSATILLYDVEYYEISNLEITNNKSYKGIDDLSDEMFDKAGIAGVAQDNGTIDHIYLNNLYIHDVNGNTLHKHMNNGGIQMNVYKPTKETAEIARYNDIKIENCRVENVSRFGITVGYTYNWNQFQTAELADETVQTYGHTNIVIRNNYVKEAGGDAITPMYSLRPLVEYNISDTAAYDIQRRGSRYTVDAAVWPWKCKDAVFQFNEIFDTVANADGQAFDCDYGDGAIYQYNYTHDNGGGFAMLCGGQAINSIIRYNISQNDLDGLLSLPDNPNGVFYNNTFYTRPGLNTPLLRPSMTGGITEFYNNIVYNAGDAMTVNDWRPSQVTFKNNIFYGYTNTPADATNVIADPKFVDPGKGGAGVYGDSAIDTLDGYKLQAASPAINAGKVIANNGGRDYFGNPVTDIPDIGAFDSQTPAASNDNEIKSSVYRVDEAAKSLFVPSVEKNPTTVEEVKGNLTVDKTAGVQIMNAGAEVNTGNIADGMTLVITAENGSKNTYTVKIQNAYNYKNDFAANQQGNVWFAQKKVSGSYVNLSEYNADWKGWVGTNYAFVGLHSDGSKGVLCALTNNANEESYSMAYRAPKSGVLEVSFAEPLQFRNSNPGGVTQVTVTKNGEAVHEAYLLENGKTLTIAPQEIEVQKGDVIRVEAKDVTASSSSFWVTPVMTYLNKQVEAPRTSITGMVKDADGNSVAGATVTLRAAVAAFAEDDTVIATTTTDVAGAYTFSDVAYGDYTVTVEKDGYLLASVNVTANAEGGAADDIVLTPEVPEEIDTRELEKVIAEAELINEKYDTDYVKDDAAKAKFDKALLAAQNALTTPGSQAEVNGKVSDLLVAMANLRLRADKTSLQNWLEKLKALDLSRYSEESARAVRAVIAEAESLLNEDLGLEQQDLLTQMIAKMEQVSDDLQPAAPNPDEESKPDTSSKTEEESSSSQTESANSSSTDTATPTTGDSAPIAALALLTFASAGALLVLKKRRS